MRHADPAITLKAYGKLWPNDDDSIKAAISAMIAERFSDRPAEEVEPRPEPLTRSANARPSPFTGWRAFCLRALLRGLCGTSGRRESVAAAQRG